MNLGIRTTLAAGLFAIAAIVPTISVAQDISAPTGDVVLTVSGAISATNAGDTAVFDTAMLAELGGDTISTTTIWTEGVQEYTGVSLKTLLEHVGATEGKLMATAINDYAVEIPVTDAVEDGPIIAYENNGQAMSVRDKGPLWVIYPFDSNPEYQSEVIYSRSIWQLDRIIVVD